MTRREPLPGSAGATGADQREDGIPLPAATGAPALTSAVAGSGSNGQAPAVRVLGDLPAGTRWLTVTQVCEWLGVSEADWSAWRAAGTAPAHVTGTDGTARVWVRHLERWLDTLEVLPEALPGRSGPTGADQREQPKALPAPTGAPALTSAVGGRGSDGPEPPAHGTGELAAVVPIGRARRRREVRR